MFATCCTLVDFRLAEESTENEKITALTSHYFLEVAMRKMAAFLHLRRTDDQQAANHMLAVSAPGANQDIVPTWLVQESSVHSKLEHQRMERGKASGRTDAYTPRGGKEENESRWTWIR
eukprot:TRINITY_DN64400_c0_g1_i1.p2 TRINITY_DN64400_c0_g1~~TRINITY_DN64400_c0_g1_i1.p2  ORF type:complete len:119 (+),score=13.95 TRINITY_DN64400_c0_g1_i1:1596-1952(+)